MDLAAGEEISFDELPGSPKLQVQDDGSVIWRLSHYQVAVIPEASNSVVLRADE
jgi:hypothetical protein